MRIAMLPMAVMMLAAVSVAQTAPSTAPSSETLEHGAITFTPPPNSELIGKRPDDLSAGYAIAIDAGQIVITIAPQTQAIPDRLAPQFASQIRDTIRAETDKGTIQTIQSPKVEPDKRFFLRIHDQFKVGNKFIDRLQLFRTVGANLVSVTASSFHNEADVIDPIHEMAENVMLSMKIRPPGPTTAMSRAPAAEPVNFTEARLRVSPPAGWTAQPTHQAAGLIVNWRDPNDQINLITLTYRPIPSGVTDPKLRDLAVEQTAAGENPTFQAAGMKVDGSVQKVADSRFLRKTRANYFVSSSHVRVTFRQVRVGDGVLSITTVSLLDSADRIESIADQIAMNGRSTR